MDFTSIKEYFYKLWSRLLLLLIIPIFVFISLHIVHTPITSGYDDVVISNAVTLTVVLVWLAALFLNFKRIKSARKGQGLRQKLEKYFELTTVRFSLIGLVCLILAVGFAFTLANYYTYAFVAHLVLAGLLWPGGRRVAQELRLRGDEREMVYHRKDRL